jgi:hypothetical protein
MADKREVCWMKLLACDWAACGRSHAPDGQNSKPAIVGFEYSASRQWQPMRTLTKAFQQAPDGIVWVLANRQSITLERRLLRKTIKRPATTDLPTFDQSSNNPAKGLTK